MSDYLGHRPIAGMTVAQQTACTAATKLASAELSPGLMRAIAAALPDGTSWSDADVEGAIRTALANGGIDSPFLLEQAKKR